MTEKAPDFRTHADWPPGSGEVDGLDVRPDLIQVSAKLFAFFFVHSGQLSLFYKLPVITHSRHANLRHYHHISTHPPPPNFPQHQSKWVSSRVRFLESRGRH
jgi:hypothetical protein